MQNIERTQKYSAVDTPIQLILFPKIFSFKFLCFNTKANWLILSIPFTMPIHCRTLFRCVFSLANTHKGMHAQTHTCKPLLSCTICYLSSQWVPVAYFPLLPLTDLMGLDALSDNWSLWNWSMEVPFVFQLISSSYLCVCFTNITALLRKKSFCFLI